MRLCACDCGQPVAPRKGALYATSACRTRDWKKRRGITGIRYVKASQNGKSGPSGRQVSAVKMRAHVEALLISMRLPPALARAEAERCVNGALPARQRSEEAFDGSLAA